VLVRHLRIGVAASGVGVRIEACAAAFRELGGSKKEAMLKLVRCALQITPAAVNQALNRLLSCTCWAAL
jgi:hypothetical protein